MFYAPWCGHCKALKPEYVSISEDDDVADGAVTAVDCTVMVSTCQKYGVSSYPQLKWFGSNDSDKGVDYEGGRDGPSIRAFIKSAGKDVGEVVPEEVEAVEIDKDEL